VLLLVNDTGKSLGVEQGAEPARWPTKLDRDEGAVTKYAPGASADRGVTSLVWGRGEAGACQRTLTLHPRPTTG
jgi:hypothetical protein